MPNQREPPGHGPCDQFWHRTGQRQFIERPLPTQPDGSLSGLLEWLDANLADNHTLKSVARQAALSPRTLLRRFQTETGSTPYDWIAGRRVARAQELLEHSALSMEEVARAVGLASGTLLRHHFHKRLGISPSQYRQRFRSPHPERPQA